MAKPDKPVIEQALAKSLELEVGTELKLEVKVKAPTQQGEVLIYEWSKKGVQLPGATGPAFRIATVAASDQGPYQVKVCVGRGADATGDNLSDEVTSDCSVVIKNSSTPASPTLTWDPKFVPVVLGVCVVLLGACALPVILLSSEPNLAKMVAAGLLIFAATFAIAGVGLALLDLRGRSRLVEVASGGRGVEIFDKEKLSETLKAWGGLGLPSAILALAAIAMICATMLGWRSLPNPDLPASPTPTPSATATPPPANSPSPGGASDTPESP